ncbi:MAG TPA: 3-oxoacid CoA-transferase subunit B [Syntrophobacteraceae bacterium]|nr:3-oxoacid CoA-transferase subunit B [Syntrophobacteraceae bacterium]
MPVPIADREARERVARRIAGTFVEQQRQLVINLGVGIPTMVADYISGESIFIQAENGMLGVGKLAEGEEIDRQLINAGRQPVTETPGCSYFDSATSFGMIRGGHVDATVIGAFQVDEAGNIANWINPNGKQLGVGGAMDLVTGARQVVVGMQHNTRDGKAKLVKRCTMPITGFAEVDLVVTELGLFRFTEGRLVLEEIAPEVSLEELRALTEARFEVGPNLRPMAV